MEQEHILVIDDEEGLLQLLKMRLNAMGFTVTACTSGREAVNAAKTNRFDLAITDLRLRGEDGLDVTEELLRIHPGLPVIILTAHGSIPNAVEAVQRGAFGYLTKPFDDKELKAKIEEGLSPQRMSREIQRLKSLVNELYGMENVVARSPAMQRLLQQVIQVADSDATMLLFGETGTGKEVFARVTHANSRRSKGPFVALNCAAIPETLFESELFGHVRGAFTSAHGPKKGLFQSANGGTLFLDEIGEMPLSMQVKLLRAVQEREVREVGAEHPTKVDVRIIAATNKDLGEAVKNGSFRNDLYYRISVVPLFIPPLRDRRDDIPILVRAFFERYRTKHARRIEDIEPEAYRRLLSYSWPGNVRELQHAIERAVLVARTSAIMSSDLPESLHHVEEGPGGGSNIAPSEVPSGSLEEIERASILKALESTRWNKQAAAALLGLRRPTLYSKMRKHNIPQRRP